MVEWYSGRRNLCRSGGGRCKSIIPSLHGRSSLLQTPWSRKMTLQKVFLESPDPVVPLKEGKWLQFVSVHGGVWNWLHRYLDCFGSKFELSSSLQPNLPSYLSLCVQESLNRDHILFTRIPEPVVPWRLSIIIFLWPSPLILPILIFLRKKY